MTTNVGLQLADRLLALEVRSRRIGFAVFEGPSRLLDWGIRSCSHPTPTLREVVAKRVRPLFSRYDPVAVVIRNENQYSSQTVARFRASVSSIRKEARRCGVDFRLLKATTRKHFFARRGFDTKYRVAEMIGGLFEELSWKAPPRRRAWHSESYHTIIFDAAATGLAALADDLLKLRAMKN